MSGHLLLVAFVWAMVAFAVAIDASRRGRHGGFWAALTFVTGPFGAVVYGLVVLTTDAHADGEAGRETETNPGVSGSVPPARPDTVTRRTTAGSAWLNRVPGTTIRSRGAS